VTLTYATGRGHALIGRALYLPKGRAVDEEHRELAGVPEEVMFAYYQEPVAGMIPDMVYQLAPFWADSQASGERRPQRLPRQAERRGVARKRHCRTLARWCRSTPRA
jgi:hypothetical protein